MLTSQGVECLYGHLRVFNPKNGSKPTSRYTSFTYYNHCFTAKIMVEKVWQNKCLSHILTFSFEPKEWSLVAMVNKIANLNVGYPPMNLPSFNCLLPISLARKFGIKQTVISRICQLLVWSLLDLCSKAN